MRTNKKKYQRGLVLSGGGARGISHLGSVKALYEHGYTFDIIIGTSMGAIVGCLLADGYRPDDIVKLLTKDRLKSFVKADISKDGFMTMKGARMFLSDLLSVECIEELQIPFIATATDLQNGTACYFTQGNIIDRVVASASIPIVFSPVTIEGKQYVDGGVLNNLPARHIRNDCAEVFGFHVNPQTLGLHQGKVKGFIQIAERTFHLAMLGNVVPDENLCDFYLEHEALNEYSAFDFMKAKDIFEIGYVNTKAALGDRKE